MLVSSEISNENLTKALRLLVQDLCTVYSPFTKDESYLRNLAGWIAKAATRIEAFEEQIKAHNHRTTSSTDGETP